MSRRAAGGLRVAARGVRRARVRAEGRAGTSRSVFDGAVSSPGTLQLLALCLVFGGLALTYDLLFGFTGLLSFGHALYVAVGVYLANIAITDWHWSFAQALLFTALVGLVAAARARRRVSLRVGGIAFAMVTLAFAQAGAVLVHKNPHHWTTARRGSASTTRKLPTRSSASSTRRTCTGSRSRYLGRRLPSCAGPSSRPRAASGRRSARTSCASRCSACARAPTS